MKKMKISFQKLMDDFQYPLHVQLEVFNWMLKTGKRHRTRVGRWTVDGLDKCMFNYSANDYESYSNFGRNFLATLQCGFCNAIVKTPNKAVKSWRDAENISLTSYRMLSFPEQYPKTIGKRNHYWNIHSEIKNIFDYVDKPLKKKYFHPTLKIRKNPKILSLNFSTAGDGYRISFCFSFKCFDYEPGWYFNFDQKKNESIDMFVYRFHNRMKVLIQK